MPKYFSKIEASNLKQAYIRIFKNVGVGYKNFYALHHTFTTRILEHGADIKTVQELMGHTDVKITMIYLHPDINSKKKAVESIRALIS